MKPRVPRPRHEPSQAPPKRDAKRLNARVDELLAKISREGISSLTDEERRFLQEASQRYRGR